MSNIFSFKGKASDPKNFANKRAFLKKTQEALVRGPERNIVIICADIASFRLFNEKYGVEKGDDLLCFIAEKIGEYTSKKEGFIAYSYDQDAKYLISCYADKFNADVLLYDLDLIFQEWSQDYKIYVKLGLAKSDGKSDLEKLIQRANMATGSLKAKESSVYAYFDELMLENIERERNIVENLNSALLHGDIIPYFQPQYDLKTGELVGAEMLARWITKEDGLVSPGVFIPVLEKNGLDTEVDMYLWGVALSLLKKWRDKNYKLPHISLNVSSFDFFHPEIVEYLVKLIKKNGLTIEDVHIEISCSAAAKNYNKFVDILKKFIANGFILEIGNFGSEQTSMKLLMDVPVNVVKLDRSIVAGAGNERGEKVLSAMVKMIKEIGPDVTTEGVETEEQCNLVKELGTNVAQGYYFSKPISPEEFENRLKNNPKE